MANPIPSPPWARLFSDVKIDIPGVTNAVFQQVLFRVWKDFCDKTNIWIEEVPIDVAPPVLSYPFTLALFGAPNRLMLLYDPTFPSPDRKWVMGNTNMQVPGIIQLAYAPSSAATWNAVIAKIPFDPTDDENYPELDPVDYWIVDKYREALYFGVLARLQASPSKPYTNPTLAQANLRQYSAERSKARGDVMKANTFGGQRWAYPQSFATAGRKGWM
jgi:hypothetical protein